MTAEDKAFVMSKVLSIDEIYRECRELGADRVVSCDPPLVTALNARSDSVMFGFAYTPRQVADEVSTQIIGTTPDTDLEVSRAMMHITGHGLRFTHSTVKKIRDIRRYTHEVDKFLLSRKERTAYEAYRQTHPLESIMEVYDPEHNSFFKGHKTAVVDLDLFSSLDKKMKPDDCEEINNCDPAGEDFAIDRIYSIGNDRQIAECIADLITPDNWNDVAIVLDSGGSVVEAVRSALYRRGIPFKNELSVKDLAPIRDYIRFLDSALNYSTVRCGDVRELFTAYGAFGGLANRTDAYLLCRITTAQFILPEKPDAVTVGLIGLMRDIYEGKCTFLDVVDRLPRKDGLSSVKILLRDMDISDESVTREGLDDIEYAVNNIDDLKHNEQIPEDERRGVLLADCKKSIYIDRSLVFFVGLDDAWHVSPAGKDYIVDPAAFEEKEAWRLRILLQQGDRRIYIIRPATDGKETVPCQTFEVISQVEGRPHRIEHFSDICSKIVPGSWHSELGGPVKPDVSRAPGTPKAPSPFSKSEYNNWRDCPYKYAFGKVLKNDFEDSKAIVFGNEIHDFCEYCFCYPDYAAEGFDDIVKRLLESYSGISQTCLSDLDASRFRTLMKNALNYIRTLRPAGLELDDDNSRRKYPNGLIADDPRTGNRCSSLAEEYLDSAEGHMLYSKFDLRIGNEIYDWKTGGLHNTAKIVEGLDKRGDKNSEVQPLMYIQALREKLGEGAGPIRFNLVYLGAQSAAVTDENDPEGVTRCIRSIEFSDMDDVELLDSLDIYDKVYDDVINSPSTYSKFTDQWDAVVSAIGFLAQSPGWVENEGSAIAILNAIGVSANKTNMKSAGTLLRKFGKFMANISKDDRSVYIRGDYLDAFVEEIDKDASEAVQYMAEPFFTRIRDNVVCRYCNYQDLCMSSLSDDRVGGDSDDSE